jgi:hypothetical protein
MALTRVSIKIFLAVAGGRGGTTLLIVSAGPRSFRMGNNNYSGTAKLGPFGFGMVR